MWPTLPSDDLATPARQLARLALDAGATRRRCVVSLAVERPNELPLILPTPTPLRALERAGVAGAAERQQPLHDQPQTARDLRRRGRGRGARRCGRQSLSRLQQQHDLPHPRQCLRAGCRRGGQADRPRQRLLDGHGGRGRTRGAAVRTDRVLRARALLQFRLRSGDESRQGVPCLHRQTEDRQGGRLLPRLLRLRGSGPGERPERPARRCARRQAGLPRHPAVRARRRGAAAVQRHGDHAARGRTARQRTRLRAHRPAASRSRHGRFRDGLSRRFGSADAATRHPAVPRRGGEPAARLSRRTGRTGPRTGLDGHRQDHRRRFPRWRGGGPERRDGGFRGNRHRQRPPAPRRHVQRQSGHDEPPEPKFSFNRIPAASEH